MTDNAGGSTMIERPLMTAADTARFLDVSYEWLLEHADDLGVIRLGNGQGKGQMMRFSPEVALERAAQLSRKARPA
jgi:hypothetical protein